MEFKTVEHSGRVHVIQNGVESECFAIVGYGDHWLIYCPTLCVQTNLLENALEFIAAGMDTWYTVPQAAARLVELGKCNRAPHDQTICRWCREDQFPDAVRAGPAGGDYRRSRYKDLGKEVRRNDGIGNSA